MINSVMPLFELRNLYKKFNLGHNLKTAQHFHMKLGTHVPRSNLHIYNESDNTGFNNFSEMTLIIQTSIGIYSVALFFANE